MVILQSLRRPVNTPLSIAVILGGLGMALAWRYGFKLADSLYEVLPGMAMGFVIYAVGSLALPSATPEPEESA
jgi:sodium/proline symporter